MFKSLLPKEYAFFDNFADHARIVQAASRELLRLTRGEVDTQAGIRTIKNWEHEADAITHRCSDALNRTFITLIDRPDILRLIKNMDDVQDCIDAALIRMGLHDIRIIISWLVNSPFSALTTALLFILIRQCHPVF